MTGGTIRGPEDALWAPGGVYAAVDGQRKAPDSLGQFGACTPRKQQAVLLHDIISICALLQRSRSAGPQNGNYHASAGRHVHEDIRNIAEG